MRARFPEIPLSSGHYESYYLRAAHPERPLGVWLRHTVHKAPNEAPIGSTWLTVFDGESGEPPRAFKASTPAPEPAGDDGITIAGSTFTQRGVHGATPGGEATWALDFSDGEAPLQHLPAAWMYRAPLPRTKSGSPFPAARLSGTVTLNHQTLELDRWPGMLGHNWGTEHAERWIWLHGIAFEDAPGAWIDLVCGRIKVAGRTTPWVANGVLHLNGTRHRLGGIHRTRATRVEESATAARIVLPGDDGFEVTATVQEPAGQAVAWRYADPSGGEHHSIHCSIARLTLELAPSGRTLVTPHAAAYELGVRETTHGVPVQPFPDP